MPEKQYDILICGAGLAGLSLLYRAMQEGVWTGMDILVVDRSSKQENDKTWSFWKKGQGPFDALVYHQWQNLFFYTHAGGQIPLQTDGYTYNSIRSIDFYTHVLAYLKTFPNIRFIEAEIVSLKSGAKFCELISSKGRFQATYLFNSIYQKPALAVDAQYFLQHFKGWKIKTSAAIPALTDAYLMDFRTGQEQGTTFFYTLPMAKDELFVEYTLFSKTLLPMDQYAEKLKLYIKEVLHIEAYEVREEEFGVIPMTDHPFPRFDGNIVNIGTLGGDTRASTGYTFTNVQKTVTQILQQFRLDGTPFFSKENIGLKTQLYDTTLLNVLAGRQYEGHQLFADLFTKSRASLIFAFLDAETSVFQDIGVMKSLKIMPFLQAFTKALSRRLLR
jgi:lycopene beta-cyclase